MLYFCPSTFRFLGALSHAVKLEMVAQSLFVYPSFAISELYLWRLCAILDVLFDIRDCFFTVIANLTAPLVLASLLVCFQFLPRNTFLAALARNRHLRADLCELSSHSCIDCSIRTGYMLFGAPSKRQEAQVYRIFRTGAYTA